MPNWRSSCAKPRPLDGVKQVGCAKLAGYHVACEMAQKASAGTPEYVMFLATVIAGHTWSNLRSASSYAVEYTFTGRRLEGETGLYYFRHRMYHSQMGRFVSRDPLGYSGSKRNLAAYGAGMPTVVADPLGTKCGCPKPDIKKTLQADLSSFPDGQKTAELWRMVRESFPYSNSWGVSPYIINNPSLLGSSGFVVGYELSAEYRGNECCCDLSKSKVGFMAIAARIHSGSELGKVLFGTDEDGHLVGADSPSDTMEHELWHTDGAKFEYGHIEEQLGQSLVRKRGYRHGFSVEWLELYKCFQKVVNDSTSQENCEKEAKKCIETHLNEDAFDRIIRHGAWHADLPRPISGYRYLYNEN